MIFGEDIGTAEDEIGRQFNPLMTATQLNEGGEPKLPGEVTSVERRRRKKKYCFSWQKASRKS